MTVTITDLLECGATYRQLDYWTRRGYLRCDNPNPGSGSDYSHERHYPQAELDVAQVMAGLCRAGFEVTPDMAQVARELTVNGRVSLGDGLHLVWGKG